MNRYEMEPILNPAGRFVIYGDHLNAIEKLEARVVELEEGISTAMQLIEGGFDSAAYEALEALNAHK